MVACLASLPACSDAGSPEGNRHPRSDLIVVPSDLEPREVSLEEVPRGSDGQRLELSLLTTLGSLDGSSGPAFGRIEDLEHVDDSTLAIVDSRNNQVVLSGIEDSRVTTLGGAGEGPREFRYPSALTVLSRNLILVSDSRGRAISVVTRSDSGWAITDKIQIDVVPLDLCANDAGVFVHGFSMDGSGEILHVYDHDLNRRESFGRVYEGPNASINQSLSRGQIACLPEAVLHVSEGLGEVRRYSNSGELDWVTRFDGFKVIPYIRYEEEGRTVNPLPDEGGNFVVSLVAFEDGDLMVQAATITREGREEGRTFDRWDTYVLSGEDGSSRYRVDEPGWIIETAGSATLVGVRTNPYPQVGILNTDLGPATDP